MWAHGEAEKSPAQMQTAGRHADTQTDNRHTPAQHHARLKGAGVRLLVLEKPPVELQPQVPQDDSCRTPTLLVCLREGGAPHVPDETAGTRRPDLNLQEGSECARWSEHAIKVEDVTKRTSAH